MNPKVTMVLRILLGVFMVFFGLNKFLGFTEFPPMGEQATTLMTIYAGSGFLKIIGVLEILGGLGLIIGKYVPLSLTFLLAILFNATVFHALHNPANIGAALVGLILGLILVFAYKERFVSLLSA